MKKSAALVMPCLTTSDAPPMVAPEPDNGMKQDQVLSGVGVFPMRTENTRLVPVGVALVQEAEVHVTAWPPSKTRERKLPEAAYGLSRIQSTVTTPPPAW